VTIVLEVRSTRGLEMSMVGIRTNERRTAPDWAAGTVDRPRCACYSLPGTIEGPFVPDASTLRRALICVTAAPT